MRQAHNFQQAREAAKDFQGIPLINGATGMKATVSRNNLDKMLSVSAVAKSEYPAIHAAAVANVDSLFQRAILGWSKPARSDSPDIKAIHRFFAAMVSGGRSKMVKLTVKEVPAKNNPLYTLEVVDWEEAGQSWLAEAARQDGFTLAEIPQRGEWVVQGSLIQDHPPKV